MPVVKYMALNYDMTSISGKLETSWSIAYL